MTLEGYGSFQIAAQLSAEHIPIPAYHQAQLGVGLRRQDVCPQGKQR